MLRTETKRRAKVICFENPPSENEGGIFYALAVTVTGETIDESRGRSARTLHNSHDSNTFLLFPMIPAYFFQEAKKIRDTNRVP